MDSFNCDHLIQPCQSAGLCFTRRLIMGNVDKTWSSLALDYASSGLQDDIEVVVSAVEQNNEAL